MQNLLFGSVLIPVLAAQASGSTLLATDDVDLASLGARSIVFFGTVAQATGNAVRLSMSENGEDFLPVAETELTLTGDGNVWAIEAVQPYGPGDFTHIRAEIDRSGTATGVGETWAATFNHRQLPAVSPGSSDQLIVVSPVVVVPPPAAPLIQ